MRNKKGENYFYSLYTLNNLLPGSMGRNSDGVVEKSKFSFQTFIKISKKTLKLFEYN